jgi:quercetin dioxygenase-like cupin family protein/ketosteroid isomerase-like protein
VTRDEEAFVRAAMDAYNARDHAALAALWTPETVWAPSLTGGDTVAGGEYLGHEGLTRYFAELDEVWTSFETTPITIDFLATGHALIRNRISGRGRTSGATVEMENWVAFAFAGRRLRSAHACPTREEALAILERLLRTAGGAVVSLADGETISDRAQRNVVLLADRPDLSMTWSRYAAGEPGPGLHVHHEHTDAFYVLEGQMTFRLGPAGDRVTVGAGGFVAVPPNIAHGFANESDAEARFLNFHAPDAGFAAFMRAAARGEELAFDSFDVPSDGGLPASGAIVSAPGEGERMAGDTRTALMKVALSEISLAEWVIPGDFEGPPVHDHDDQVDAFYVIDGELEVTVEDSAYFAGPGMLACVPRGVRHTFGHPSQRPARFLNIHAPDAGFAEFLRGISH